MSGEKKNQKDCSELLYAGTDMHYFYAPRVSFLTEEKAAYIYKYKNMKWHELTSLV